MNICGVAYNSLIISAQVNAGRSVQVRASFYSRLPAGHDKIEGYLAQISCVVAIHFIPNLACVIFT